MIIYMSILTNAGTDNEADDVTEVPYHNMAFLSPVDRIAIIGGVALFLLLVLFIMMCKLWPGCFLYKHCPLKAKYDKSEKQRVIVVSKKDRDGSVMRDISDTLWSSLHRTQIVSTSEKETAEPEDAMSVSSGTDDPGTLKCDMFYSSETETLNIDRIRIGQLTGIKVPKYCNPCVKVYLNKKKMKAHKRSEFGLESEFVFHTECCKNSLSPKFEATFEAKIKQKHIKRYIAHFLIFDCDRYSHIELIGEAVVSIKRIPMDESHTFVEEVKEPQQESTGEILLSLNYLPTAEKLSCTVLKLQNLTLPSDELHDLALYVKISLQHEKKTVVKHRTSTRHAEANPNFNETLSYDVPIESLGETVMILELLYAVDIDHKSSKDIIIGKLYLGSTCEDLPRRHWTEMMQSPRKAIAYWHELK